MAHDTVPLDIENDLDLAPVSCFGSVQGRIQCLSNRGSLCFTLYDHLHDQPVVCFLEPGNEGIMREAWGHLVEVQGLIQREKGTHLPSRITHIKQIQILPETDRNDWHQAIGAFPVPEGSPLPEEVIRLGRNGFGTQWNASLHGGTRSVGSGAAQTAVGTV